MLTIAPGDAVVIRTGSRVMGPAICEAQRFATRHERMTYGDSWKYDHAAWYEGDDWIWEASVRGIHRVMLSDTYPESALKVIHTHLYGVEYWEALQEAQLWRGTPYGWADDAAMALGVLGCWPRWVENRCRATNTLNCSEYVARILDAAGRRPWGTNWWRVMPYQIAATPN